MATYKSIQGYTVQSLASDPSASVDTEGQVWYNSASNVWKVGTLAAGSWSAGGELNTGRFTGAGAGVATAGLIFGGTPPVTAVTESYDGSTWTAEAVMANTRNSYGSFGTKTSGVVAGGAPAPTDMEAVEEFTLVDTIQTITST